MDLEFFESLRSQDQLITKDEEGKVIIEKLNVLINGDKWKQRFAICILNSVLEKCDDDVFEEQATLWMRFLMKLINTIPSENLLHMCFVLLSQLIRRASCIDKLARDISMKGMDPLLTLLVGTSVPLSREKINILKCCILCFPAPCGHYRDKLLKLVIGAIESDDCLIYSAASQMFTLLSTCGTAGEKKNRLAENWINQFYQVVNTTFYYMSKLRQNAFSSETSDASTTFDTSKLIPFSEISEKIELPARKISVRIERLLLALRHIISTAMSFEVQVPMVRLVKLFCELSNLIHVELKETEGFSLTVIKLTDSLLKCISVTVNQFKGMLLMYSQQFGKILSSAISLRYFSNRHNLYQCIVNMLKHWGVLPAHIFDSVLVNVFNDIKIYNKPSQEENYTTTNKNRKDNNNHSHNLREDIDERNRREGGAHRYNYTSCQNAYAALKLLENILVFNGPLLSEDNLNYIVSNVSQTLVNIYRRQGFLSPYSYGDNRLMLLKVARCLLTLHHGSVQIPKSIVLSHFTDGSTELHDGIKGYCNEVLLQYDCIMHSVDLGFQGSKRDSSQHGKIGDSFVEPWEDFKMETDCSTSFNGNVDSVGDNPSRLRNSADHVLAKESRCGNSSSRLRSSADHVLAKETKANELPRRSSAESVAASSNPAATRIDHAASSNQVATRTDHAASSNKVATRIDHAASLNQAATRIDHAASLNQVATRIDHAASLNQVATRIDQDSNRLSSGNMPASVQQPNSNLVMLQPSSMFGVNPKARKPCASADQVLAKASEAIATPRRSYSEPNGIISCTTTTTTTNNAVITYNSTSSNMSIHIDDDNLSPDKECMAVEDIYDEGDPNYDEGDANYGEGDTNYDEGGTNYDEGDTNYDEGDTNYDEGDTNYDEGEYEYEEDVGPVVISDSSEDDVALTKSVPKFSAKPKGPLGNLNVPTENMYTPLAKRAKMSTGGSQSLQYTEDDEEYILSTFCDDTDADDL